MPQIVLFQLLYIRSLPTVMVQNGRSLARTAYTLDYNGSLIQMLKLLNLNHNGNIKKKKTKQRTPTVKTEGLAYISRGRNRPRMAESLTFPMNILKNPPLIRQFPTH